VVITANMTASMASTVASTMNWASMATTTVASTSVTEGRSSSYCSKSKEKRELHFRCKVLEKKVVERKFLDENC